jgi:hypothetical protein
MKKIRLLLSFFLLSICSLGMLLPIHAQEKGNFDEALQKSTNSISHNIRNGSGPGVTAKPQFFEYLKRLIDLLTPIIISVGVAVVLF